VILVQFIVILVETLVADLGTIVVCVFINKGFLLMLEYLGIHHGVSFTVHTIPIIIL